MNDRSYWVYILSNFRRSVFYVGITSDLGKRTEQHLFKDATGFSQKYQCNQLLHAEQFGDVRDAIEREKQVKGYRREKKILLIRSTNPEFIDITHRIN